MHDELERNNWALTAANRRLETMATTDPLTGLLNHGALVAALDRELERSQRYGRPCAVLFLDVDHFKALNDSYGHPAGDTALIEFSTAVRSTLRAADTLGRWGGEEFVAILPETGADDALLAAEKIRAAVVAYPFAAGGGTRLTCSVGVAACPTHAGDRSGLIKAADQAMYAAKRLGRDQARLADDPDVTTLMSEATAAESREEAALAGTVRALATLAALRNIEAVGHMQDIASLASRIAVMLGLDDAEARMIGLAGQLHDVGTAAIPDAVLGKPDRLTDEEWHVVRAHPAVGADVIGRVPGLGALAPLIRAHHERWDGHGYPDGLAGTETPLGARIVTVADAYSAMTTARPYREARTSELALHELWRCAGTQFDPAVVAALEQVLTKDAPRSTRDDIHLPANARSSD